MSWHTSTHPSWLCCSEMKGCEGWQRRVLTQPVGDNVPSRDAFPLWTCMCEYVSNWVDIAVTARFHYNPWASRLEWQHDRLRPVLYGVVFEYFAVFVQHCSKEQPLFHSFIHSDIKVGFKHPLHLFISPKGRHADWLKPKIPGKVTFTFSILAAASLFPGCAFVAICSFTTGASSSSLSRIWRLRLQTFLTGESASWTPFCTFRGLFAGLE